MEIYEASEVFSSLSQETRLKAFKILIQYGKDGLSPGVLAQKLKVPANTLSFHLSHMDKVGLVTFEKNGRSLTYFANTDLVKKIISYLQENCCLHEKKSKNTNVRKC